MARAGKLSKSAIEKGLKSLPGWSRKGDAIARTFTFKAFPDSISFATRLAFDAEAADHHPDLLISYTRVTVTWSTHSAGGITAKDLDGAAKADAIGQRFLA